jgi:hypothetical protein
MRTKTLGILALLALLGLSSCTTVHSVRWSYGMSSAYPEPDEFSDDLAIRAVVGLPLIVGSIVFDAVTWPIQALFGVWPLWGDASKHMKPPSRHPNVPD